MAVFHLSFYSKCLYTLAPVSIILPIGMEYEKMLEPGEKFQTLYLLHGYGGNCVEWSDRTKLGTHAMHHKFAVVMPFGDNSFYTDMGKRKQYFTYITEELPAFLRKYFPLSDKREDNFIAGISMGGYGTAKIAFNCPEKYAAAGIFAFGPGDPAVFARGKAFPVSHVKLPFDLDRLKETKDDLWDTIRRVKAAGTEIPKIYNACGSDDFIYPTYVEFGKFAEEIGLEQKTRVIPGVHGWEVWNEFIDEFVDFLPLKNRHFWLKWYKSVHPECQYTPEQMAC